MIIVPGSRLEKQANLFVHSDQTGIKEPQIHMLPFLVRLLGMRDSREAC